MVLYLAKTGRRYMKYDFLIVGAGLFGAVFAHEATSRGKRCLVVEKRPHVGGNVYTEKIEGIEVHKYGAHIFHTSNQAVWDYLNQFVVFNNFINEPLAVYKGEVYNLPFNMNTFSKMWNIIHPLEAASIIAQQKEQCAVEKPSNLEEQALSLVGRDIYEKLIRGYTEKQWGRDCKDLPAFIIQRVPVRFTYNNNYFNDRFQGIPTDGYTSLVEKLLAESHVECEVDFLAQRESLCHEVDKIVYTGAIDAYFDYKYGALAYRSLNFETQVYDLENYQGNAVVNYTERAVPYTRIIEHKHFNFGMQPKTVITKEFPSPWELGKEAYYPINDAANNLLYQRYLKLAQKEKNVLFGGRLGKYCYYNMDQVVDEALSAARQWI